MIGLYTPLRTTINYSAVADLHTVTVHSYTLVSSVFTSRILATDL
jgi:hypothetical protein